MASANEPKSVNPNRLCCLGCRSSFSKHREPHAVLYAPFDSSFLLITNIDPGRIYYVGDGSRLGVQSHRLGVAHHACVDDTAALFAMGGLKPSSAAPIFVQSRYETAHDLDAKPVEEACAFCGTSENLNNEHVWPRWISKLLRDRYGPRVFDPSRSSGAVSQESINVLTPICSACNGGWLGVLETDVKPFLSKMVVPKEKFFELSVKEQHLLAVWAYKTALMMDLTWGPHVRTYHYALLRTRRTLPANVKVWIGAYHGPAAARTFVSDAKIGERVTEPNAFTFTFTAFKALFQVIIVNPWGDFTIDKIGSTEADHFAEAGLAEIPSDSPITWPRNGVAFADDAMDTIATRFRSFRSHMYTPDGREFEN